MKYNNPFLENESTNAFIDMLLSLSETELSLFGCILGFYISSISTTKQQNSLGNFFELVGQVLLTMNAQSLNLSPSYNQTLMKKINDLEKEILELKKHLY